MHLVQISSKGTASNQKRRSILTELDDRMDRLKDLLRDAAARKVVLDERVDQLTAEILRLELLRITAFYAGGPVNEELVS